MFCQLACPGAILYAGNGSVLSNTGLLLLLPLLDCWGLWGRGGPSEDWASHCLLTVGGLWGAGGQCNLWVSWGLQTPRPFAVCGASVARGATATFTPIRGT